MFGNAPHATEAQVVGAEVVPPLRRAVRFVDGEETHVAFPDRFEERVAEALGRHVDELVGAAPEPLHAAAALVGRDTRVDEGRADPVLLQPLDLILHECEERGDHERRAAASDRGSWKQATCRRGMDHERVLSARDVLDDSRWPSRNEGCPELLSWDVVDVQGSPGC
jgi:hypothetical protein